MKDTRQIAAALAMLSAGIPATAQQADTRPVSPAKTITEKSAGEAAANGMIKVEINGANDYDPRRDDTASKTVIRQEDILKYGDTNVFDVLKRAPGVTVIGESIRMRGLGNGYTSVLVNGERPPPGFQLQSVPPEQIERIEIVRAATAEFSTRAIAGTINIVLKKVVSKAQRNVRFTAGRSRESDGSSLVGTYADRSGNLSYFVSGMLTYGANSNPATLTEQFSTADGTVQQLRDSSTLNTGNQTLLALAPRLTWKLANNDLLTWSASLSVNRNDSDFTTAYTNRIGNFGVPDYRYRTGMSENRGRFFNTSLNWIARVAGGKLDSSASLSRSITASDSRWLSSTADRHTTLQRDAASDYRTTTLRSNGKYTRSVLGGHALAAGWDVSRQRAGDDLLRVEGFVGSEPVRIHERFEPVVTQLAAFLQDEWNITKQWSMYLGTRWEAIHTDSALSGEPDTRSRSRVFSPIAQTLYKFPDKSGRQLRLALTRTYKAPALTQLTARRNHADLNTRFSPDSSGNPALQPELATGVDISYEHFWAPAATFSVSAASRRISNYIRTTLSQDSQGLWLYQPVNDGDAWVRSLDVELKFPAKAVWSDAPAMELRGSINRNWSRVSSVPGPDNRLDQQIPLSAVFGVDYNAGAYTTGASFALRTGGPVRISEQQSTRLQARRDLDIYLLYKINSKLQVRVTGNNLLPRDHETELRYEDANGVSHNWGRRDDSRRLQVNLEMKL